MVILYNIYTWNRWIEERFESNMPEKVKTFLENCRVTLRRIRSYVIYFDSRRSFNPDLRSLMKRKRRSSGDRNFSGHQMSRATVKSSFHHAFTHPPPQHVRIYIYLRATRLLYECRCWRWDRRCTRNDVVNGGEPRRRALLNGLLCRGNNALNCDLGWLEDGIVPDWKIRTHTSHRDILKELLELHFSCERSVANIYNL